MDFMEVPGWFISWKIPAQSRPRTRGAQTPTEVSGGVRGWRGSNGHVRMFNINLI